MRRDLGYITKNIVSIVGGDKTEMFSCNSEIELESGFLRSGKIFRSGKIRKNMTRRGSFNATERRDYDLVPYLNRESYDEED